MSEPKRREVCNIYTDSRNVTWHVMAYYELSDEERVRAVSEHLRNINPQNLLKPFSVITIPISQKPSPSH